MGQQQNEEFMMLAGMIICAIILSAVLFWLLPGHVGLISAGVIFIIVAFFSGKAFSQPILVLIFGVVSAIIIALGLSDIYDNTQVAGAVIGIFVFTILLAIYSRS